MNVKAVDLWYPGTGGSTSVDAIEVELVHVRAARSVLVTYDFDRDGYVISAQPDPGDGEFDAEASAAAPYRPLAFVPAWDDRPATLEPGEVELGPELPCILEQHIESADGLLDRVLGNAEVYAALPPQLLADIRVHLKR